MAAVQTPLLLTSFTSIFTTLSSTTIEEEQQQYDYKALYEARQFFAWLFILLSLGVIFQLRTLYVAICKDRQLQMRENGAAAVDELKDRLKLEFTKNDVLGLGLDAIEGIARDEETTAGRENGT
ncbi:predicted protein [Sclerotinia sclerotiorum 1980 UF-70]|uniref:Uncharacterized protein n=2 Tax=Sclerotinia sclerotiorum (strain ATCC 18683 / 1980 / Ss-1) TaxID=665079 RepID=A7EM67_SCLS1|nr:predicted protein [Sclerotinia sclerotiorum 1980 UF-70]APA14491.1 hypothetical protein sscle_13g092610 [Sclerotinia sclerotiorum 1980 UF-70]EDO03933.1 predicted protein [Sclerotinia sclerotiorum 1980 UF-70]